MKFFASLLLILSLTFCSSNKPNAGISAEPSSSTSVSDVPKIQLGFNAKGSLQTSQQVALTDKMLEKLSNSVKENLHIRVNGGTRSQKEMPSEWSNEQVKAWADLSKKHGVQLVYVVNGSDTPKSQRAFIQKWIDAGASFSFIEMMNEYYLPKFRKGDTSKEEVSRQITPEYYANEMLSTFIDELKTLNLPLFLICAPEKSGKVADIMTDWNRVITKAVSKYKDVQIGVTIHLYLKGNENFNYNQINKLREMLPAGTPIAITEAGVINPNLSSENEGKAVLNHYVKIASQLKTGDYLFDQVLYTNYKKTAAATLHPNSNGLTPKGEQVVKFMKEMYPD